MMQQYWLDQSKFRFETSKVFGDIQNEQLLKLLGDSCIIFVFLSLLQIFAGSQDTNLPYF